MSTPLSTQIASAYVQLTETQWEGWANHIPSPLSRQELDALQGMNETVSLREVCEVYVPVACLLHLYIETAKALHQVTTRWTANTSKSPYMIGLAGSVAVGKSTTGRILQALLSRWKEHQRVALVPTDGFLYPNRVLEARGIMHKKGFPDSYDQKALTGFAAALRAGEPVVQHPVYSHHHYDVLEQIHTVEKPDVVIVEGLNVLQPPMLGVSGSHYTVADFFDFSIFVDAAEADIRQWYVTRFLMLRDSAFKQSDAYFHKYAGLSDAQAKQTALDIWDSINGINLKNNILPTRERAHLILNKSSDHAVHRMWLRKI